MYYVAIDDISSILIIVFSHSWKLQKWPLPDDLRCPHKKFSLTTGVFQSKYSGFLQPFRRQLKNYLEVSSFSLWSFCALTDTEKKRFKMRVCCHLLDRSLSVCSLTHMLSFTGPLNDVDISLWLYWLQRLGICFQPYCTGLSANGCCSPAWPANSSLLMRSYWWDVVLWPQAMLMVSHKDEPTDGWYITGFFSLCSLLL